MAVLHYILTHSGLRAVALSLVVGVLALPVAAFWEWRRGRPLVAVGVLLALLGVTGAGATVMAPYFIAHSRTIQMAWTWERGAEKVGCAGVSVVFVGGALCCCGLWRTKPTAPAVEEAAHVWPPPPRVLK